MDWNRLINEEHSIVNVNIKGRSESRAKAMKIALHLNKHESKKLNHSTKVLREYLRQLVGPDMYKELEEVFTSQSALIKNRKAIDNLLTKIKMHVLFNNEDF